MSGFREMIMKRKEQMKKEYPDMDESRFEYTIGADKKSVYVWFIKDDGHRIRIISPEFINSKEEWIYLHNKPSNKKIIERKEQMRKKYPDMDESRFEYTIGADKKTVSVWFIKDDGHRINISDHEFINTKDEWIYLHNKKHTSWPKIFSGDGTVYPITLEEYFSNWRVKKYYFPKRNLPYKINKFRIYVNETDYFPSNLPNVSVNWYKLSDSHPDSRKEFDYHNPYFSAICAMYTATFLSGISKVHLTESNSTPKLTTSLMRFHVYFWLRRFIRYLKLLSKYSSNFTDVKKHIPIKAKDYDSGDGKYTFTGFTNIDSQDFVRFIPSKSNGFTKVGLELLNQSIEAFIYCVLAAQARTRRPIVGMRASALETQDVFRKLVEFHRKLLYFNLG